MSPVSGALRRRRRPTLATRFKIAWVFICCGLAVAAYGGYVLVTLPQFKVQRIEIRISGPVTTRAQILAVAGIDRRRNMWLLDTARIARRIEALPYVDRAEIHRRMPAQIDIAVTEREPAACIRAGHTMVTIDRRQRILQAGCATPDAVRIELAHITLGAPGTTAADPGLVTLLSDGRALAAAQLAVRSIRHDTYCQLVAIDARGVRLLFGDDTDLSQKAKLVGPVLASAPAGQRIQTIDLRAPSTPTVQYR